MDITVSARHMDISTALRAAAEDKIGRLSRFRDALLRAEVHFREEQNPRIADREVCEVWIDGPGRRVHCRAAAADPFAAIDLAVSKLEQQLHKLKIKEDLWSRQGPRRRIDLTAGAPVAPELDSFDVALLD